MASLDPVVDLYNAVSIRYAVPVGGENFAAYAGMPQLVVADGTETFDTMKDGKPENESPEAGEVVWRVRVWRRSASGAGTRPDAVEVNHRDT